MQIIYAGGDLTDTNNKFALYKPRHIDAYDFLPYIYIYYLTGLLWTNRVTSSQLAR